ncbi:hypothetical protein [Kineosporia succinea]|uniref:DUF3040 family protein n=1 Tax=Kineosporia succinea TaxID=84632 RepID=A0ABT9NXE6_9ACTN|nr:hypothetical protein [Kineosporia succinea]MDP9825103.1 hypothetical protein [Kineosporia succinea]
MTDDEELARQLRGQLDDELGDIQVRAGSRERLRQGMRKRSRVPWFRASVLVPVAAAGVIAAMLVAIPAALRRDPAVEIAPAGVPSGVTAPVSPAPSPATTADPTREPSTRPAPASPKTSDGAKLAPSDPAAVPDDGSPLEPAPEVSESATAQKQPGPETAGEGLAVPTPETVETP